MLLVCQRGRTTSADVTETAMGAYRFTPFGAIS